MKHPARTTAAAVLAGLCLIGTPALAHAAEPVAISTQVKAQAPGAIVSKPIVCDDVYGVANGNAIVTKSLGDNKFTMELVNSKGDPLFKLGFIHNMTSSADGPSEGLLEGEPYRPVRGGDLYIGCPLNSNGTLLAWDNAANEKVLVDHNGKIVARGWCDTTATKSDYMPVAYPTDKGARFDIINIMTGEKTDSQIIGGGVLCNIAQTVFNPEANRIEFSAANHVTDEENYGWKDYRSGNFTISAQGKIENVNVASSDPKSSTAADTEEATSNYSELVGQKFEGQNVHLIPRKNEAGYMSMPTLCADKDGNPLKIGENQVILAGGSISRDGAYYVTDGQGHYGSVKPDGSQVLPVKYEGIVDLGKESDPSKIMVKQDGAWYIYDFEAKEQTPTFTDTTADTPHMEDIQWLAQSGISKGFPDGTFRPYASMARCDMAAFLYRLAGEPAFEPTAEDKAAFPDVTDKTDHAKEIWWMASQGIAKGFPDGTFKPYGTIVRQDMAAFLHRMSDVTEGNGAAVDFSDVNDTTPHAEDIAWMAKTGVSEGWKNDNGVEFRGMADVARCDMAAFLHRMETKDLLK